MRRLWLILALLLFAPLAHAAIAHGGSCSGTTSCTPSSSAAFQLEIAVAVHNASTTVPSLPTGWTSITTKTGTSSAMRVACRVEYSATAAASGTFTNATNVGIVGYTGTGARATQDCAASGIAMGAAVTNSGSSTTPSFTTLTMINSNSTSWVLGLAYDANSGTACTPSGMTSVAGATTGYVHFSDTNGAVSSWSTTTCTDTPSANWITATLEILVPPSNPSELPQLVWSYLGPGNTAGYGNALNGYPIHMDPALSGNTTLLALEYPQSAGTPTITDNGSGNSWTSDKTCSNGTTSTINLFRSSNTSVGTSLITVTFSAATYLDYAVVQVKGIVTSSPTDGTGACNAAVTPSSISLGNLANSGWSTGSNGDLIVQFAFDEGILGAGSNQTFDTIWGSGWTGISAEPLFGAADQGIVQATSGTITPSLTIVQSTFDAWDAVAVAYKTSAGQGTATAYGVRREQMERLSDAGPGSEQLIFPCTSGNFIAGPIFENDSGVGGWNVTAVVDKAANTWNEYHYATDYPQMYYSNSSATCNGQDFFMVTGTSTTGSTNVALYELVGALSSGAFDSGSTSHNTGAAGETADTTLSAAITTTSQTLISVAANTIANGTYEMIQSEIVQVTGGGGTDTLTITRGMWGSTAATHASSTALYPSLQTPAPAVTTAAANELIIAAMNQGSGPNRDTANCSYDMGWAPGLTDNNALANGDGICHQYHSAAGTYNTGWYVDNGSSADDWFSAAFAVKFPAGGAVVRHRAWVLNGP